MRQKVRYLFAKAVFYEKIQKERSCLSHDRIVKKRTLNNLVNFNRVVIRSGIDALHAVIANLVWIEITYIAFAAFVADLALI